MDDFAPKNAPELYQALTKAGLKGSLTLESNTVVWLHPNGLCFRASVDENEGYVEMFWVKDGKEISLTHWHPSLDEICSDLTALNNGKYIVEIKEGSLFSQPDAKFIEKEKYAFKPSKKTVTVCF